MSGPVWRDVVAPPSKVGKTPKATDAGNRHCGIPVPPPEHQGAGSHALRGAFRPQTPGTALLPPTTELWMERAHGAWLRGKA